LNEISLEIAEKLVKKKNKTSRRIAIDAISKISSKKNQDSLAKNP
jgi:hypothetical protein